MKPFRVITRGWLVAAALSGCAATETEYGADVRVTAPELVAVTPGVEVVADADEPLFYSDGYYWLYRNGVWMRSDSYRTGFAQIDVNLVPGEIRQIQQPQTYAHYRRHGEVRAQARGGTMPQRTPTRRPEPRTTTPPAVEPQRPVPSETPPVPYPNPMPTRGAPVPKQGPKQGSGAQLPQDEPVANPL